MPFNTALRRILHKVLAISARIISQKSTHSTLTLGDEWKESSFHSSPNAHATNNSRHHRSHITLTVTLALLLSVLFFPTDIQGKERLLAV